MKKLIILAFALAPFFGLQAQYNGGLWAYTWDISFGLGETNDFISQTSFRGFNLRGSGFVTPQVAIGGQFSWHTFYQKEADKVQEFDFEDEDGNRVVGDIWGTQFRYINSFPLLGTVHWYSDNPVLNDFAFFVGGGVGTSIIKRRLDVGVFTADESKWHFTVAPEAGIVYGFNAAVKAYLSAQYFYSFKTSETPSQNQLSLHIGFASTF